MSEDKQQQNPVIKQIEEQYPETTDEFKRIMFTQYELFCLKQSNYGPGNIAVGSSLETEDDVKKTVTRESEISVQTSERNKNRHSIRA